jgi:hypothetical protein
MFKFSVVTLLYCFTLLFHSHLSAATEWIGYSEEKFEAPKVFELETVYLGMENGEKMYTAKMNPKNLQGFDRVLFITGSNYQVKTATGTHTMNTFNIALKGNNLYIYRGGFLVKEIPNYTSYNFEEYYHQQLEDQRRERNTSMKAGVVVSGILGGYVGMFLTIMTQNHEMVNTIPGFAAISAILGIFIGEYHNDKVNNIPKKKKELITLIRLIDYFLKNPNEKAMTVKAKILRRSNMNYTDEFNRAFCAKVFN